jgi:hypothetical protein
MPELFDRYQKGFYQEVYDELLLIQAHVFEEPIYEDALLVARAIMRRVRYNLELLIPRLQRMGYEFGKGIFFDDVSPEEKASITQAIPIFKAPDQETAEKVASLERLTGPIPLSLKFWYEEVGCVNLIGLFPSSDNRTFSPEDGCILDPLFIYSVEMALTLVNDYISAGVWHQDPTLSLAPDNYHKYGFSGAGTYAIRLPCKAFDAPLLIERHHTTFVNYLRICFRWGGFPGLESDRKLSRDEIAFLTTDLVRF